MKKGKRGLISRRDLIKAAGVGTLAAGIAPSLVTTGRRGGGGRAPPPVRAECGRHERRRHGGRETVRKDAPPLPEKFVQPEHEEVLQLHPRLDHRSRGLPEEPVGEGGQTGWASN